jgi:acyl-CoA synthetase (AMP-forming)/AMP-acid ligase II
MADGTDWSIHLGGENIYAVEIENRRCGHPSISRAAVAGIHSPRYGEVVGSFLQQRPGFEKPSDNQIREWTRLVLGRHKALVHVFWFGEEGVEIVLPQTGSGKVKKHVLREWGKRLLGRGD